MIFECVCEGCHELTIYCQCEPEGDCPKGPACPGNLVVAGIDPEDGDRIFVCDTCKWTFGEADDFGKPPDQDELDGVES